MPESETYLSLENAEFDDTKEFDLYFSRDDADPVGLYGAKQRNAMGFTDRLNVLWDRFDRKPEGEVKVKTASGTDKTGTLKDETRSWYNGRKNFITNLGYGEDGITQVTLIFGQRGVYTFDDMKIICRPMAEVPEKLAELRENTLGNAKIGADTVTGDITLDRPKIPCLSIPYSPGWTAYADGEKAELKNANPAYMALPLGKGKHEIKLVYHTPLLKAGAITSAFAFAGFAAFVVIAEIRRKKQKGK